jgi:hypothetical protein
VLSPEDAKLFHKLPRFIVINCSGFNYVDVSGIATLREIAGELSGIHVEVSLQKRLFFKFFKVLFAAFKGAVRDSLQKGGFYQHVPKQRLFPTVNDAVTFARDKMRIMSPQSTVRVVGQKRANGQQQLRRSEISEESTM